MDEVCLKLETKEEYKQIIDHLEHSILNIYDDQIEFVNSKFLNQFQDIIRYQNEHRLEVSENEETTEIEGRPKTCSKFMSTCLRKK